MNWDTIAGNWKQFQGKARQQWGKLTDDDLELIKGKRDELAGRIQERYGIAKDEAERQIDDWTPNVGSGPRPQRARSRFARWRTPATPCPVTRSRRLCAPSTVLRFCSIAGTAKRRSYAATPTPAPLPLQDDGSGTSSAPARARSRLNRTILGVLPADHAWQGVRKRRSAADRPLAWLHRHNQAGLPRPPPVFPPPQDRSALSAAANGRCSSSS